MDLKNFLVPTPNPSTSRQSQKASNDNKALLTREPSHASDRRMAESELRRECHETVKEWSEFKPSRSRG